MAIPSSGAISFDTIQTEFGGTNPIGMDEYYAGGSFVQAGASGTNGAVPSSGAISMSLFFGTTKPPPASQQAFITSGSYSWVAPTGVTKVSIVAVGAGGPGNTTRGGGGGGLGYKNNYTVIPGTSYTVSVSSPTAGESYFVSSGTVFGGRACVASTGSGGTFVGDGGGNGGSSGNNIGGNGAGGYSGDGGYGSPTTGNGTAGSGGGGGGGGGQAQGNFTQECVYFAGFSGGAGGGGGVGLLGQGGNGAGGTIGVHSSCTATGSFGGGGGSSGGSGTKGGNSTGFTAGNGGAGGAYGGGAGVRGCFTRYPLPSFSPSTSGNGTNGTAGSGAVRIIWPGCARSFPSTRTANE